MSAEAPQERRIALALALVLPWLMLLVTDWTVTPVGMIDAWVYRALGRDLVQGNASLGEYYYAARPFVLVPRYLLTRVFLEGSAHFLYGVLCATALLLAVLDFLTSVARRGSWVPGVLIFGTCHYLLRSLGWGYVDGSILAWFMVGLAGVARWYRPGAGPRVRWSGALVAGGCFGAMLVTHPMSLPMLLTPLTLIAWQGRRHALPRTGSLGLALVLGSVATLLACAVVCQGLYGRFSFFGPIVQAALHITPSTWKLVLEQWLPRANWLVIGCFGWLSAVGVLASSAVRRTRLTSFEGFAVLQGLGLLTAMVALELFTPAYWLEYPWFVSYFLPSALLVATALLGERTKGVASLRATVGLAAVVACVAALTYRFEVAYFVPSQAPQFLPVRQPELWLGKIPLFNLQLAVVLVSLVGLGAWRWLARRPGPRSTLVAAAAVTLVTSGPINFVAPGDAPESQAATSIAQAMVIVQDELHGTRPLYWYDDQSPLARVFQSIASTHLSAFSRIKDSYPDGARSYRGNGHSSYDFFEKGDAVVVLDDTADRFARAQRSFSDVGIDLKETRRAKLQLGDRSYWLIFAVVEPRHWLLRASDAASNVPHPTSTPTERISEHEKGYLAFGPYMHLSPGTYRVTYHLRLIERGDASAIALVDVGNFAGPSPQVFKAEQIFPANAGPDGTVDRTFEFTIKEEVLLAEFRVFAEGNARLAFRSVEVQPPERVVPPTR